MSVHVRLAWTDPEPTMLVRDVDGATHVEVDPRLSESQVVAACAHLDGVGDAVLGQWRATVGIGEANSRTAT